MTATDLAIVEARRQLDAAIDADNQEHTEATRSYRQRCWIRWRRCCGYDDPPPADATEELADAQEAVDEAIRVYSAHPSDVTFQVLRGAQRRRNAAREAAKEMSR